MRLTAQRYEVKTGTNWRGDRVWYVYDRELRLTVASYDTAHEAVAFVIDPHF